MSFNHGAHCPKIGELVHVQNCVRRVFLDLWTDFIDMLISYKVSFLWKSVCTMSRVKNNYSLKIWAIYCTTEGLKIQFLVFFQSKKLKKLNFYTFLCF